VSVPIHNWNCLLTINAKIKYVIKNLSERNVGWVGRLIKLKDSVPDVHRKGRTLAKTENEVTNGLEMRAAKLASLVDPSPM
jgi:hypothetical protein